MANEETKTENTEKKKKVKKDHSKLKKFLKALLIFALGGIVGTFCTMIFSMLIIFVLFASKDSALGKIVGESKIVDKDMLWKIDTLEAYIDQYYYEDVDPEEIKDGIYHGMMSGVGDPYTCYYTEEEFNDLLASMQGNYEGIGAYLKMDTVNGYAVIDGFIDGGSAGECGLISEGDLIVAVDGEDVYGQSLDEVVSKVRGPEGTEVTVTFENGDGKYDVTLERRKIETPTVKYEAKEDGIWYIQITEFDTVTTAQFEEALNAAKEADMKGLIIDLRGNPGGNLDTVTEICGDILPKGIVVYTEDKYGNREDYYSDGKSELDVPLVVLVDGSSASASEIMAGAIKDYQKGTLIGTTTYGKGIVQTVRPLLDGTAVKITTSKYYTPNGNNIHKIGIEPDIEVKFDSDKYKEDETDNQLDYALDYIKDQLK